MPVTSNEIYCNRYVTGSLLRSMSLTIFQTLVVLMFPTSVGFGIIATMVIVLFVSDWRKNLDLSSIGVLIGAVILGLIAVGMFAYGIKKLIHIWITFSRFAFSRRIVLSGQPLSIGCN